MSYATRMFRIAEMRVRAKSTSFFGKAVDAIGLGSLLGANELKPAGSFTKRIDDLEAWSKRIKDSNEEVKWDASAREIEKFLNERFGDARTSVAENLSETAQGIADDTKKAVTFLGIGGGVVAIVALVVGAAFIFRE